MDQTYVKTAPSPYRWLLPLLTLSLCAGVVLGCRVPGWELPLMLSGLGALAALLMPGWRRCAALMLAALGLGAAVTWHADHPALPEEGTYVVTGVVVDEVKCREDGQVQTVLANITLNGMPVADEAWWTAYPQSVPDWLEPGVRVCFTAELYHPQGSDTDGGYNFRQTLMQNGITIGLYGMDELTQEVGVFHLQGWLASLRHRATEALQRAMGEESGSLAAAMLLGSRSDVLQEDQEAFRKLGISHILSISGYHVGVLALLLTLLLKPMELPRWLNTLIKAAILALYALLTGAHAPVVRAGLLVLLTDMGKLQQRRNLPLHLLCLAAAMQLLYNPMQLFGASFQLSYGAMLGIVVVYPALRRQLQLRRPWAAKLWEGFCLSAAAQLGLLPAQLYWFGGVSVFSVLVNVPVLMLMSGVMALYWLMLAVLPIPVMREALGAVTGWLTTWLREGIHLLSEVFDALVWLPRANWITMIGWALLMAGAGNLIRKGCKAWRRALLMTGMLLLCVSLLPVKTGDTYWMQFSVGEADAALLRDQDAVIVVDTGEDGESLAAYLHQQRLPIDTLIITHLHGDHAGGIRALLDDNIPVDRLCLPVGAEQAADLTEDVLPLIDELAARGTQIVYLSRGDVIQTVNARFTVLWPQRDTLREGHSANDTSLVLQAEIMGTTMLLTGDLSARFEHYIAQAADILKAAHHGSTNSTSADFLQTVTPQVILLSCGNQDREAALLPRTGDIPVYSTNTCGTVTIRFTREGYTVETTLEGAGPLKQE